MQCGGGGGVQSDPPPAANRTCMQVGKGLVVLGLTGDISNSIAPARDHNYLLMVYFFIILHCQIAIRAVAHCIGGLPSLDTSVMFQGSFIIRHQGKIIATETSGHVCMQVPFIAQWHSHQCNVTAPHPVSLRDCSFF